MQNVANILFDFGNVLIDIDIDGAISRIAQLRSEKIAPEVYEAHVRGLVEKYEVDEISTDLFINGILKHAHHSVQALDVIEAWNSMLIGIPAFRLGMLEQLKQNFGLFMLSNTNELHIAWVHEHLAVAHGIDDFETRLFDEVYYSHKIKARKPDPASFLHVKDDAFITPGRTLFIDDLPENIQAAKSLGFRTMISPPEVEVAEVLKLDGYY